MSNSLHALEVAIAHGDLAEVHLLLDREPGLLDARFPANIGLTPLMWACRNRRDSIVRALLDRGAAVDSLNTRDPDGDGGNTALWFTAQGLDEGTVAIAGWLLDAGAPVNTRCEHGTTAFYMAAVWVHLDLVQYLVIRGADPAIADDRGENALAAVRRHLAWCAAQPNPESFARKRLQRAPRMIAFLERILG